MTNVEWFIAGCVTTGFIATILEIVFSSINKGEEENDTWS